MAERIVVSKAGWCLVAVNPSMAVSVRFGLSDTGRIAIVEMTLSQSSGITADYLRAIPVGRIEAWANGPGRSDVLAAIEEAHTNVLTDWSEHGPARAAEQARVDTAANLGVAEQFAAGEVAIGAGLDGKPVVLRSRVRNLRLKVPEGQPKPDSFYRKVAHLYGEVQVNTARPAAVIAEANEVPVTTVHGWIKEARRRGLLAPGERQARRQG